MELVESASEVAILVFSHVKSRAREMSGGTKDWSLSSTVVEVYMNPLSILLQYSSAGDILGGMKCTFVRLCLGLIKQKGKDSY